MITAPHHAHDGAEHERPCLAVAEPSPGADVEGSSPVPAQMWEALCVTAAASMARSSHIHFTGYYNFSASFKVEQIAALLADAARCGSAVHFHPPSPPPHSTRVRFVCYLDPCAARCPVGR